MLATQDVHAEIKHATQGLNRDRAGGLALLDEIFRGGLPPSPALDGASLFVVEEHAVSALCGRLCAGERSLGKKRCLTSASWAVVAEAWSALAG